MKLVVPTAGVISGVVRAPPPRSCEISVSGSRMTALEGVRFSTACSLVELVSGSGSARSRLKRLTGMVGIGLVVRVGRDRAAGQGQRDHCAQQQKQAGDAKG